MLLELIQNGQTKIKDRDGIKDFSKIINKYNLRGLIKFFHKVIICI